MGGKTKTYSDVTVEQVYDQSDNLYTKEMVRYYGLTGGFDSNGFTKTVLDASIRYFSTAYLEAMGVAPKIQTNIKKTTNDEYVQLISRKTGIPEAYILPIIIGINDLNNNSFIMPEYRLKEYFEKNYIVDRSVTVNFTSDYSFAPNDTVILVADKPICYVEYTRKDLYYHVTGLDTVDVSLTTETNLYHLGKDYGYTISNPIQINDGYLLMDEWVKDGDTWKPTNNTIQKLIPQDERTLLFLHYIYRHDGNFFWEQTCGLVNDGWYDDYMVVWKEEVPTSVDNMNVFILPIKHNFDFVEDRKYQAVAINSFGFKQDDFEESFSDDNLKHAFLSYMSSLSESHPQVIQDDLNAMYPSIEEVGVIEINDGLYNIYYDLGKDDYGDYAFTIEVDLFRQTITPDDRLWITPINNVNKLTFQERYDFLKQQLCILGNTEVTVRLKWYQTGLFKLVFTIVAIAFVAMTGGLAMAMTSLALNLTSKVLSNLLGDKAGMILGIAFGLVGGLGLFSGGGTTSFDSIMNNWFNIVVGTGQKVMKASLQAKVAKTASEYESITNQTKEMQDEINEIQGQYLYIPLRSYDDYYNNLYNGLYNNYDTFSQYDRLYTPKLM